MKNFWKRPEVSAAEGEVKRFLLWILLGILTGIPCGFIGFLFHQLIDMVTEFRSLHSYTVFFLPAGAVLTVLLYRAARNTVSVNDIIEAAREGAKIPALTIPLIFITTLISQLCGGSSGKEGAAIQMGGTTGKLIARHLRLDKKHTRMAVVSGVAAFFAAVFGTPVTAVFFAVEVVTAGSRFYVEFIPCLASSFTAYMISSALGLEPLSYTVAFPEISLIPVASAAFTGLLCAVSGIGFCFLLHKIPSLMDRLAGGQIMRALVTGILLVLLFLPDASEEYKGAGFNIIEQALKGESGPEVFALKMAFTVLTVAAGLKGGEVVPTLAIGAALGCAAGALTGVSPAFCAALGMTGLFCAVVNCPVASVILGVELFGSGGLPYYLIVCTVAFALSGTFGLYDSRKFLYQKTRADVLDSEIME